MKHLSRQKLNYRFYLFDKSWYFSVQHVIYKYYISEGIVKKLIITLRNVIIHHSKGMANNHILRGNLLSPCKECYIYFIACMQQNRVFLGYIIHLFYCVYELIETLVSHKEAYGIVYCTVLYISQLSVPELEVKDAYACKISFCC